ncbi:MAG TPA: peptide ABC transporter ATP-binding protein, partial [Citreicella sp.]|nr:peptide ABC transporter ATP-binding protein [Citreicella sp.]
GKSLIAHAILGLLPRNALLRGTLEFDGQVLGQPYPPGLRGRRIA